MSGRYVSYPITGGQFGAQERKRNSIYLESDDDQSSSSVGNLGRRGQFGASNLNYQHEEDCSDSDEGTMMDESDAINTSDFSSKTSILLSERSKKTLKQMSNLSKYYYLNQAPFLLRLSKKPKKNTFSIELQTFSASKNVIVTDNSGQNILFLVNFHPLKEEGPPCSNLVELIEDLYIMSRHRSNLKNKNKITGRMSGIGFRGGYEEGKTAGKCSYFFLTDKHSNSLFPSGTYAVRTNMPAARLALEEKLQQNLPSHNKFVAQRFRHFSQAAYDQNRKALQRFGIPSWSDESWESYSKDPEPLCSNVIVTSNDFSNKVHGDKDKNVFTYGIFSYINPDTGTPILPPSSTRGHGIRFPEYDCNINFGTTPGIIEVFWKSNQLAHHTIGPPAELKTTKSSTHFGCSFQISHMLVSRALNLKNMSIEDRRKRTINQAERSKKNKN